MTDALLDPWMLAFKGGDSNAEIYLQGLLDLHDAVSADGVSCEVSASASALLEADGLFPLSAHEITNSWMRKGDIFMIVGRLLDKLPKIEDRDVMPLIVDQYSSTPSMDGVLSASHESHLQELVASSFVIRETFNVELGILSRAYPAGNVDACCDVIEMDGALRCSARLGRHEGMARVGSMPDDLCSKLSADEIAIGGDISLAISTLVKERGGGLEWFLGIGLVESLRKENFFSNPSRMRGFLRTVGDIVLRVDTRSTHALRTSKGGSAKQIARGTQLAWRVDVDDEYHIHYWSSTAGIEIAKVVTHNDFSI